MARIILTILAIISALIQMWGEYGGPDYLIYIFKPLTLIFIILIAALAKEPPSRRYKAAIIAGLLFSLAGDILLIQALDMFVFGVLSFLIAQLIYAYAFRAGRPFRFNLFAVLPFAVYGVLMYVLLQPGLEDMALPVAAYVIVILVMAWQAWDQWDDVRARWALLAFVGALLFIFSDSLLALNRFLEPFTAARALTLTTYFSAQWLISNSNYT